MRSFPTGLAAVENVELEAKEWRRGDGRGGGSVHFLAKPALCLVRVSVSSSGASAAGL